MPDIYDGILERFISRQTLIIEKPYMETKDVQVFMFLGKENEIYGRELLTE